jgi:PhnB protein
LRDAPSQVVNDRHRVGVVARQGKEAVMPRSANPVPKGYRTVTPYIIINGAARALEFYARAFGAVERLRMPGPNGTVGHAEIAIGNSRVMLADEFPAMGAKGPGAYGGSPVMLHLYVDDADAWTDRAVKAGAKLTRQVEDQFYGDRMGAVEDPFGYTWFLSTHVEDISAEEMQRRAAARASEAGR